MAARRLLAEKPWLVAGIQDLVKARGRIVWNNSTTEGEGCF